MQRKPVQRHPVLLYSQKAAREYHLPAELLAEVEFVEVSDIEKARHIIKAGSVAAVIVDDHYDSRLEFLQEAAQQAPSIIRILWTQRISFDHVARAINKGKVFRVADLKESPDLLAQSLVDSLSEFRNDLLRVELVRRSARHNRELEELTLNLEGRVEERTKNIVIAKEQEEDKLNRIRKLVKFVKDLTGVTSVEELFTFVKNDLRSFHQVVTPVLVFSNSTEDISVVFSSKSQIINQNVAKSSIGNFSEAEGVPSIVSKVLARPIAKILSVPLELKHGPSFLLLEHTANLKEVRSLEAHLNERRRPVEMALDRLLLEGENNYFSFRWEKTFDNLQSPVCIVDRDNTVLRANREFHKLNLANVRDIPSILNVFESGRSDKSTAQIGGRTYQVQSYPIRLTVDGPATNVVSFFGDITKYRELQRKVLQSEKMSAIGLLAGNVAHELNNPLTGLRSLAQVLKTQVSKGSPAYADLEEIEKAAARSQGIIRNLLDFTSGGDHKTVETTMDEVVEKTLPFLKSMMRNHRLQLRLNSPKFKISVEPSLLQQVVFNLINNACQAMKDAGTLLISTQVLGSQVELSIQDTGPGIPENIRDRIFEAFFTTKAQGHGTGLGLSLSKEIVEKFKGQISFSSEHGKGTNFKVILPGKESV